MLSKNQPWLHASEGTVHNPLPFVPAAIRRQAWKLFWSRVTGTPGKQSPTGS